MRRCCLSARSGADVVAVPHAFCMMARDGVCAAAAVRSHAGTRYNSVARMRVYAAMRVRRRTALICDVMRAIWLRATFITRGVRYSAPCRCAHRLRTDVAALLIRLMPLLPSCSVYAPVYAAYALFASAPRRTHARRTRYCRLMFKIMRDARTPCAF